MIKIASNTLSCDSTKAKYTQVGKVNSPTESIPEDEIATRNPAVRHAYENISGVITPESDLHDFMPPTRVLSESEKRGEEELEQGFYKSRPLGVHVIPCKPLQLPQQLKVFVHERGEVGLFPPTKKDISGKLCENLFISWAHDE